MTDTFTNVSTGPGSTGQVVNPVVWGDPNAMFSTAEQLINLTEQYIGQLQAQSANLFAPVVTVNYPKLSAAPLPVTAPLPALQTVTWTVPTLPGPFTGLVDASDSIPGPFTVGPPQLQFPVPPTPFVGTIPAAPSIDLNFVFPPTLDIVLPQPPALLQLDTVTFNTIEIPDFDLLPPVLSLNAPSVTPYVEGTLFTSSLLQFLEDNLQDALTGSTGLPPAVEANLWGRASDREFKSQADALADLDRMEAMGFAFPPGVWLDARLKVQTETNYVRAGLSRDVMVKQAELMLDNLVKAREQATNLEGKLIDYANNVAQRAFEATKYATEAGISIYNAEVQAYAASLQGFTAQVEAYKARIFGIQAQIEELKAQIAFEQTKAEINTAIVSQYKTEVEAQEALVDIYKAQLSAVELMANIQKIKVDVFGAQIQAFTGQVNAYTAQIDGYKSLVATQGVIENVYKDQVDAYSAEVNAGVAKVNAQVAVFKAQVDGYTANLEGYKAAIEGMVGQADAASKYNEAAAAVYRAEVEAIGSYNGTLTAQWQAVINEQIAITQVAESQAKANGDLYIAARGLSLDATKVGAQVAAQIGSAAVGAIHWANNSSWSLSGASNVNTTNETIQSTAKNTNINESV